MKWTICIISALLFWQCSNKNIKTEAELIIDNFFFSFENDNIDEALDKLFLTNQFIYNNSKNEIQNVRYQLESSVRNLGEYCGYELITKLSLSESICQYSFLVKYELKPLRFSFVFYKAKDNWSIYNFKYDDTIINEVEEASKFYYFE